MYEVMQSVYFGNTLLAYLSSLGVVLLSVFCWMAVQYSVKTWWKRRALKTPTILDDLLVTLICAFSPVFYGYFSLFLGLQMLVKPQIVETVALVILLLLLTYESLVMVQEVISEVSLRFGDKKRNIKAAVALLSIFLTILIWLIGGSIILANMGIDPTALIAGLGVGGIILAFAVQNVVGDLFQYFALRIDNPITEGDFVTIGDKSGYVHKIGLRSTRLKSLTGEEVVIHNKDLTSTRVLNFGKAEKRGSIFRVTLALSTPQEKAARFPEHIRTIIEAMENTDFVRSHMVAITQTGLVFETYYKVRDHEYMVFLDTQEQIVLRLLDVAAKEGYVFADKGLRMDS